MTPRRSLIVRFEFLCCVTYFEESQFAFFVSDNISETVMANLENTQMLHADETGSVTLPVYSGDQALTPVHPSQIM